MQIAIAACSAAEVLIVLECGPLHKCWSHDFLRVRNGSHAVDSCAEETHFTNLTTVLPDFVAAVASCRSAVTRSESSTNTMPRCNASSVRKLRS